MPARIVVAPNVWDLLLQQMRDENAALHVENGRLRAENERLHSEGSAKDAEIERQRAEIAVLRARLGRPKKTPRVPRCFRWKAYTLRLRSPAETDLTATLNLA